MILKWKQSKCASSIICRNRPGALGGKWCRFWTSQDLSNFILPISATICWVPAYSEDSSSDLRRGEFGRLVSIHSFLLACQIVVRMSTFVTVFAWPWWEGLLKTHPWALHQPWKTEKLTASIERKLRPLAQGWEPSCTRKWKSWRGASGDSCGSTYVERQIIAALRRFHHFHLLLLRLERNIPLYIPCW